MSDATSQSDIPRGFLADSPRKVLGVTAGSETSLWKEETMSGMTDLAQMLRTLTVRIREGEVVYVTLPTIQEATALEPPSRWYSKTKE